MNKTPGYTTYQFPHNRHVKASILIKEGLGSCLGISKYSTPNLCIVQLITSGKRIFLTSIYVEPKDDENETLNHLEQFIIETGDAIHIIAGDLNGWHQLWGSPTANKRDPNNLLNFIDEITAFIHKICKKYLPHSSIRPERPSWWTEDLEKLKRKVLDNHHLLQKLSRKRLPMNEAITNKTQLRKEYAEAIRKASTENFREFCNKQGRADVWSVTNRLLKNSIPTLPPSTLKLAPNKYTTSSEETAHIFLQKFYPENTIDTYSSQTVTRQTIKFPPNTNDDPPFTIDEVLRNLKDMNPRKSPEPDHLTSDICFCFTQTFPELITNIMNRFINIP
ncbi:unnamed protein product [Parnassius apollo]|uniref:(apollo) hypothetical protein n=1 Tax=Parnassius apollo TaxID=110799 RepID=A0A8S3X0H1_PARAO|nr:unnamed protein product [Parnassius apollo]